MTLSTPLELSTVASQSRLESILVFSKSIYAKGQNYNIDQGLSTKLSSAVMCHFC